MAVSDIESAAITALLASPISDALRAGELRRLVAGTYDPRTDTNTGDTTSTFSCLMAKTDVRSEIDDGVVVEPTDEDFIIMQLSTVPVLTDRFAIGAQEYSVVFVKSISADVGSTYQTILRKSP